MIAAVTRTLPRCGALALALLAVAATPVAAQDETFPDAFALLIATQSRPSFAILGAGARPAGMGGAFTALADDASAASFNPAGLALLVKPEASLVLGGRQRNESHAGFFDVEDGTVERYGPSDSEFSSADVNFAAFTFPLEVADRNLCLQLSYQRLIDFTYHSDRSLVETEVGGGLKALIEQEIDQEGAVETFSLAGAYQVTERMSVGLTVTRWQGSWWFTSDLSEVEPGEDPTSLRLTQDNEWTGWNATAGLLLRYRYLNVGFSVRAPFDGDYTVVSDLASEGVSEPTLPERLDGTLEWPASWTLGIAVKPLDTWFLTVDYAEYDWDDMNISGFGEDGDGELNFFDLLPPGSSTTRNTGQWRFGNEVTFFPRDNVVALRAGYFVEPRPQRLAPADESSSFRGWSVGAGLRRGQVSVDLAWQRTSATATVLELVDPGTVAGGDVTSLPQAKVETEEDRIFLSVLYQFPSREALGRMFHFLFVGPAPPPDGG
jgi:long-chain fatty acid transport protein